MTFLPKGALALLLVLTPGLALAIPLPSLTPAVRGVTTDAGGPRRPQVLLPSEDGPSLGVAAVGGPRRPGLLTPEG